MAQHFTFPKLIIAVFALALAVVGGTSLIATEAEVAVAPLVDACATSSVELAAEEVTFPITPWFEESANILPEPLGIGCIPGGTCWADWQCGGGNRGYCKVGTCVCL